MSKAEISLVVPKQLEEYPITTESGATKMIPLAKQKVPSNLLIPKFKAEHLPMELQEALASAYTKEEYQTFPVYQLSKDSFVGDLLCLPLSEKCKLIGVHGFMLVQINNALEGSSVQVVIYKRNPNIKKRFILCELFGEIVSLYEREK